MMNRTSTILILSFLPSLRFAQAEIWVAPDGSDANAETKKTAGKFTTGGSEGSEVASNE